MDVKRTIQYANVEAYPKLKELLLHAINEVPEVKALGMFTSNGTIITDPGQIPAADDTLAVKAGQNEAIKLYHLSQDSDKSELLNDVTIPGLQMTQVLRASDLRRLAVPYKPLSNSDLIRDIQIIRAVLVQVLNKIEPINDGDIIQTTNDDGLVLLQAKKLAVVEKDNKAIIDKLLAALAKHESQNEIIIAGLHKGIYATNRNNMIEYPLPTNPGVLSHISKLIPAVNGQGVTVININIGTLNINNQTQNVNVHGDHNNVSVGEQTHTVENRTIEDFIIMLRRDKPSWINDRDYISTGDLCDKYNEFANSRVTSRGFGRILSKRYPEFKESRRINLSKLLSPSKKK